MTYIHVYSQQSTEVYLVSADQVKKTGDNLRQSLTIFVDILSKK